MTHINIVDHVVPDMHLEAVVVCFTQAPFHGAPEENSVIEIQTNDFQN
jgi:hypothetical protein